MASPPPRAPGAAHTPQQTWQWTKKNPATREWPGVACVCANAQGVVYCPFASRPNWLEKLSATVMSAPKRKVNAV